MSKTRSPVDITHEKKLMRLGFYLEYLTLGWNVIGTAVMCHSALKAHSVALAAFGLDSLVEIGASTIVVWELNGSNEFRQKRGLRLIGAAFFALATFVLIQSVQSLYFHYHPRPSVLGIVWLAVTLIVMTALATGKQRVGKSLNNPVLLTEARVTLIDACLAGSVLIGLVFNAFAGFWWADSVAAFIVVFYGFKEGHHAWTTGAW